MMQGLRETFAALGNISVAIILILLCFLTVLTINVLLRYTRANIAYHAFGMSDDWYTYFIRNLDSVTYREHLIVEVSSPSTVKEVVVHGGPWTMSDPVEKDGRIRITFSGVPADAVFVVRVQAEGANVRLRIADDSVVQSRSFKRPMIAFGTARKLGYYFTRYLVGVLCMLGVFAGGIWTRGDEVLAADYALMVAGIVLSFFAFALVVPHEGKTIVAGYLGWEGTGRRWFAAAAPLHEASITTGGFGE